MEEKRLEIVINVLSSSIKLIEEELEFIDVGSEQEFNDKYEIVIESVSDNIWENKTLYKNLKLLLKKKETKVTWTYNIR